MARSRRRMSKRSSRRSFRKYAKTHRRNFKVRSMRGGIRL
ncbi:hypothetical protein BvCmsNSNP013_01402 [Escherichia coli]|nr:hypothetical protein BvCmsNSNP013_01402 [Escherichia coli]